MPRGQFSAVVRYLHQVAGTPLSGEISDADLLTRFSTKRDEAAFELLLWRHGAMVLRLCLDITHDKHVAEDAFQAVFLALACKAGSIRNRQSLGAWLHRTAYRVALRARCRIRAGEKKVDHSHDLSLLTARVEPGDGADSRELRSLLHEEVDRLPAKYRYPIILCYFEGFAHHEAGRKLGWPKGTVAGRLARAREILRKRLLRRGVGLSAALSASTADTALASAFPPSVLVQTTFRLGLQISAGAALGDVVSPHVAILTQGALQAMFRSTITAVSALLLTLVLAGSGVGFLVHTGPTQDGESFPARVAPPQDKKVEDPKALWAARIRSVENLRKIALAMSKYEGFYYCLPPRAIFNNGKALLSWRVMMLPWLNENELYEQFHFDEPWDGPNNKKLLAKMPAVYRIPGTGGETTTFYQVFVGDNTMFEASPGGPGGQNGARGRRTTDATDGSANTILAVEALKPVPWTKPEDLSFEGLDGKLPALGGAFKDAIHAVFVDASVYSLYRTAPEADLRGAITRNGGEIIATTNLCYPMPTSTLDELKDTDKEIRQQIDAARRQVHTLQQQVLDLRMVKTGAVGQDAVAIRHKMEQDFLQQELQKLYREVVNLQTQIKGLKDNQR